MIWSDGSKIVLIIYIIYWEWICDTWYFERCRDRDSLRPRNFEDVANETSCNWAKVVKTEDLSRVSLITALVCCWVKTRLRICKFSSKRAVNFCISDLYSTWLILQNQFARGFYFQEGTYTTHFRLDRFHNHSHLTYPMWVSNGLCPISWSIIPLAAWRYWPLEKQFLRKSHFWTLWLRGDRRGAPNFFLDPENHSILQVLSDLFKSLFTLRLFTLLW
jgi:hypothetical protein